MNPITIERIERHVTRKRDRDEQPHPHAVAETKPCTWNDAICRHESHREDDETGDRMCVAAVVKQVSQRSRCDVRVRDVDVRQIGGNYRGACEQRPV